MQAMSRRRHLGIALVVIAALLVAWEPTRVAFQTAAMLPSLLDAGPKPLELFSEDPQRRTVTYRPGGADGPEEPAELWLPSWASAEQPAGAMLLVFGVNNLGRNHPAIERVADGLARTGVAVLVPDSRTLLEGRLEVDEIDGVVRAFRVLAQRPEVDRTRVGIVGFSVGGSLAVLASRDPRISGDVRWVNAFGAYADARSYLASVAAHAYVDGAGTPVPWTPTPLAREVYLRFVLDQVEDAGDRRRLERAVSGAVLAGEQPADDASVRESLETRAAVTAYDLLTAHTLDAAKRAIAALPSDAQAFMHALSPVEHVDGLLASVHLMHELEDHHVPFVETRRLASAYEEAGVLEAHTEFRLFDHVQPDDIDVWAAAPELVKLLLHVRTLMEETL
jgi:dienelactone hydrolase